jgi:hypothetical protein
VLIVRESSGGIGKSCTRVTVVETSVNFVRSGDNC